MKRAVVLSLILATCPLVQGARLLEKRREDPDIGLKCVRWRKTLNCAPSGPRDPTQDKDCSVTIGQSESGFCECEGHVHVAAVPCGHKAINCEHECGSVVKLVREVFGANYTDSKKAKLPVYDAGRDPYSRAREYGDKAVKSVNTAVQSANSALNAARDMISRMMALKPWNEIAKSGKKAEAAGIRAQEISEMARPFIYGQVNTTHATITNR